MKRLSAFVCTLLTLILIGCRSSHDHESYYPVLANAKEAGELQRGWIPEYLPGSSRNIHIAYDLSPSRVWCAFEFNPSDHGDLRKNLKPVEPAVAHITHLRSPGVSWWPTSLRGKLEMEKVQGASLTLYTVTRRLSEAESDTMVFAMDWQKGQAYFTDALE